MELNLTQVKDIKEKPVKKKKTNKNSEVSFKGLSNYFKLLFINFKLANQHVGTITTGIIFLVSNLIFVILELVFLTNINEAKNIAGPLKGFWFIFGILTMFIFIFTTSLYLIKKQNKDGIQNIELRAGFSVWKSFSIRALALNFVIFQYLLILLIITLIFQPIVGVNFSAVSWIVISQIGGMFFLAFVFSPFICLLTSFFGTSMASVLSMVFAIVFSISIMVTSAVGGSNGIKAVAKTTTRYSYSKEFYDAVKKTGVKIIFEDGNQDENNKSLFLTAFENNAKKFDESIEINDLDSFNYIIDWTGSDTSAKEQFYYNQFARVFGTGQIYYIHNNKTTLLSGTNLYDEFLKSINQTVQNKFKDNKFDKINDGKVSNIIKQKEYRPLWEPELLDFSNFAKVMSSEMPEYKEIFYLFEKVMQNLQLLELTNASYSSYSWNSSNGNVNDLNLSNNNIYSTYNFKQVSHYNGISYTDNSMMYNYNISYDSKNNEFRPEDLKDIWVDNSDLEKMYQQLPEIAWFNWFAINAWKYTMNLSFVFEEKNYSSELITDNNQLMANYFRNFKNGLSLIDNYIYLLTTSKKIDPYVEDVALQSWLFINRSNTSYIQNIYDYDKLLLSEDQSKAIMKPVFADQNMDIKIKKNNAGFVVVHILISMALFIPSYYAYRKKLRI